MADKADVLFRVVGLAATFMAGMGVSQVSSNRRVAEWQHEFDKMKAVAVEYQQVAATCLKNGEEHIKRTNKLLGEIEAK